MRQCAKQWLDSNTRVISSIKWSPKRRVGGWPFSHTKVRARFRFRFRFKVYTRLEARFNFRFKKTQITTFKPDSNPDSISDSNPDSNLYPNPDSFPIYICDHWSKIFFYQALPKPQPIQAWLRWALISVLAWEIFLLWPPKIFWSKNFFV